MRVLLIFIFLLSGAKLYSLSLNSDSLHRDKKLSTGFGGSLTIGFERKTCIGLGVCHMNMREVNGFGKVNFFTSTFSLNLDAKFGQNQFYLTPRITFEQTLFTLIMVKMDLSYNSNFQNYDLRFTPNLGFTIFGWFSLCYGYNIPVSGNEFQDINRHRFSIGLNIANIF